jgi:hypothetical protein
MARSRIGITFSRVLSQVWRDFLEICTVMGGAKLILLLRDEALGTDARQVSNDGE